MIVVDASEEYFIRQGTSWTVNTEGSQSAKDMVFSLSRSPAMGYGYSCTHLVIAAIVEAYDETNQLLNACIVLQNI